MTRFGRHAAGLLLLSVALGPVTGAEAQLAAPGLGRTPIITVEGVASRDVAPDLATIRIGVSTLKASAAEASAQTSRTAKDLVEAIKASGVADRDIVTIQASLEPIYDSQDGNDRPKLKAFRASNTIEVRVRKLEQAGDLAGQLIGKGANTLDGIEFSVADPQPVLDGLRGEAVADARRRAEILTQAAGVKLGRVLEINPTSASIPVMSRSYKMQAVPAPPVSIPLQPGNETLEARVSMTWELVQGSP